MTRHLDAPPEPGRSLRLTSAGLSIALLIAACGGGADSAQATSAEPPPAPAPAPAPPAPAPGPAPAPAPAPSPAPPVPSSASCGLPNFQANLLTRINLYRVAGASCRTAGQFAPAPVMVWNDLLFQAALGHSQDMATKNYFSHTSQDGRTLTARIDATGYSWSTVGENIAAGYSTAEIVVDGWMASDGHCANIMNPNFRDVGVACVASTTSRYNNYWTMDAGRQR